MPETPDAILRAMADPERLAIAGHLARSIATALADAIDLPLPRVRKHLNRLTAAGSSACETIAGPTGWMPRRSAGRLSRSARPAEPV